MYQHILENKVELVSEENVSDKLKTLNELYKSGVLTEEEFIDSMEKTLSHLLENSPASPEPQAQMIRVIEDIHSPSLEEIITSHLRERDDDICIASITDIFGLFL